MLPSSLELLILLSQSPKYGDYKLVPPCWLTPAPDFGFLLMVAIFIQLWGRLLVQDSGQVVTPGEADAGP